MSFLLDPYPGTCKCRCMVAKGQKLWPYKPFAGNRIPMAGKVSGAGLAGWGPESTEWIGSLSYGSSSVFTRAQFSLCSPHWSLPTTTGWHWRRTREHSLHPELPTHSAMGQQILFMIKGPASGSFAMLQTRKNSGCQWVPWQRGCGIYASHNATWEF